MRRKQRNWKVESRNVYLLLRLVDAKVQRMAMIQNVLDVIWDRFEVLVDTPLMDGVKESFRVPGNG